ncbi:RagB/SusD family nutrient uptake outer membrane protein [Bacteroides heparinolyticus]|uniref:RagB/SusD family nutrient uptake outer membrane protein n=1 Tax=Prevotella heparinolytica TaxID=28113 RepID=UPI0035A13993
MKKKLLYSIFALGIVTTTLTSCEDMFGDFLDKQPSGELTGEEVFGDWGMMTQFHNDTYNFLRHGACRINRSWLDAATDLGETSYANGGVRTTFNIGNYYGEGGANELTATWEAFYRGIRKCNMILTRIESVPKGAELSESDYLVKKQNYISEARFLRAWFYWELFLRYGPIPIVTEVLDPNGDLLSNYTTRPTLKEYVVDFILKELEECEAGLQPNDKKLQRIRTHQSTHGTCAPQPHHALYGQSSLQCRIGCHMATGCRCQQELHRHLRRPLLTDARRRRQDCTDQCLVADTRRREQRNDFLPQRQYNNLGRHFQ